jgi:hypothetical protein
MQFRQANQQKTICRGKFFRAEFIEKKDLGKNYEASGTVNG